jgi:hypothetical protein
MTTAEFESSYARRAALAKFVLDGVIDGRVLGLLLVNGRAVTDEAVMWDFKRTLPVLPSAKLNDAMQQLRRQIC